jgi:hypothetical protein
MAVPSPVFQTPTMASLLLGMGVNEEKRKKPIRPMKVNNTFLDENKVKSCRVFIN